MPAILPRPLLCRLLLAGATALSAVAARAADLPPEIVEDTDRARSTDAAIEAMRQGLSAMKHPRFALNPQSDAADARLIVLDEVSMVGEEMARDLMSFGKPILVLGDPGQLPPISGGGYFMVGTVISADMDFIGQLQPHTPTRFVKVTMEEALAARKVRQAGLVQLRQALA